MILFFNVFMQITSSKGSKANAIKIPCSIFTSEEDETRYMSLILGWPVVSCISQGVSTC